MYSQGTQEAFVKFVHGIAAAGASWYYESDKTDDKNNDEPPTDPPPSPSNLTALVYPRTQTPD